MALNIISVFSLKKLFEKYFQKALVFGVITLPFSPFWSELDPIKLDVILLRTLLHTITITIVGRSPFTIAE